MNLLLNTERTMAWGGWGGRVGGGRALNLGHPTRCPRQQQVETGRGLRLTSSAPGEFHRLGPLTLSTPGKVHRLGPLAPCPLLQLRSTGLLLSPSPPTVFEEVLNDLDEKRRTQRTRLCHTLLFLRVRFHCAGFSGHESGFRRTVRRVGFSYSSQEGHRDGLGSVAQAIHEQDRENGQSIRTNVNYGRQSTELIPSQDVTFCRQRRPHPRFPA